MKDCEVLKTLRTGCASSTFVLTTPSWERGTIAMRSTKLIVAAGVKAVNITGALALKPVSRTASARVGLYSRGLPSDFTCETNLRYAITSPVATKLHKMEMPWRKVVFDDGCVTWLFFKRAMRPLHNHLTLVQ